MKIHILGICGTFMGGLALLARELGMQVSGSDANVYPPMSTQLEQSGIRLSEGYSADPLNPAPDLVIIGNTLGRGNPAVEYVLDNDLPYTSGPEWLARELLGNRWVLAVAGTHGKTTTTSMLAWCLEQAGLNPGFLIGGVAENFGVSARLGDAPFFVIEADEYDTAFFDKRSKFVHYRPRSLVINNIEFDHADIFADLDAIKLQFHHLLRTVPGAGLVVRASEDTVIDEVLEMGCWTAQERFGEGVGRPWGIRPMVADFSRFEILLEERPVAQVEWDLIGRHNAYNAVAAIAAARHAGVPPQQAGEALRRFSSVKRRLERLASVDGTTVYDDFAHHPTAIRTTLEGLRARVGGERIIVIFEPRSNTMRMGHHEDTLAAAFSEADLCLFFEPAGLSWDLEQATAVLGDARVVFDDTEALITHAHRHPSVG